MATTPMDRAELDRRHFLKSAGAGVTAAAAPAHAARSGGRAGAGAQGGARSACQQQLAAAAVVQVAHRPDRRRGSPSAGRQTWGLRGRRRGDRQQSQREGSAGRCREGSRRAREPAQHRGDEEEVRRDHDARLPAVHQGHVPGRDADGHPFSGLFGDITDDTMFLPPQNGQPGGFDPMSPSGRKWLDTLAGTLVKTGTKVQHISNNAPFEPGRLRLARGRRRRKAGVAMAKRWLEGCAVLGVKSMRMNSPQALGPPHPAERRSARTRRRLPAQHRHGADARRRDRVVQGDGRLRRQPRHHA